MNSTMNHRMATVFTGLCLAFVAIIGMLTWWQVLDAGELKQKDQNNQTAYYEQRVQRGYIETRDGVRLAGRVATQGVNGDRIWTRKYATPGLAAHVLGYDTQGHSRTGVERALNDALTGSTRDLGAVVGLLDGNEEAVGDNVRLTIDSKAQRVAEEALAATGAPGGAVVAIEPKTGRVLTMASYPTFSPAEVVRSYGSVANRTGAPLLNRATLAGYPPGSTFKLVTTAAALDDGVSPDRTFKGGTTFATPGPDVHNFPGEVAPAGHDLTEALTHSYNTSFAELGTDLGPNKMRDAMRRFGFFSIPPLRGLPHNELRASGLSDSDTGKPLRDDQGIDVARVAIGQERLTVTPLQMALVTAGIANGGKIEQPTLIERVARPGGGVSDEREQQVWKEAMSPSTARELTRMMGNVVEEGTGQAVKIPGLDIAGKTGTADYQNRNLTWFVAFAPANDPKVAIAVAVEGQGSGQTGGLIAAPIAKRVFEALLRPGGAA
ncbi:MAG: Peptidoglycan glycosyltransferase [Thermoleophilia bacterium]|nr:Peptidoglycan glycosyltransferase [Thermoleophilia bacterium]